MRETQTARKSLIRLACPWVVGLLVGALVAPLVRPRPAIAQENPNSEQLHKMYDDALKELKAAQERKNQLSEENDKLKAQVEELKKQVAAVTAKASDLERDQAEQADKTFYLRTHFAAWEAFIRQYPELMGRWKLFMETDFITPKPDAPPIIDQDWPISAEG